MARGSLVLSISACMGLFSICMFVGGFVSSVICMIINLYLPS